MNALEEILKNKLRSDGAMPFAQFMELCLFDTEHGYYNTHDPLNDFATAPEISQLFGEMIALWCIDSWMKLGSPAQFTLLECGPGRGTLMEDVLRTAKIAPEFLAAAQPVLLEKSHLLKAKQQEKSYAKPPHWISDISEIAAQPIIMFCNEFFDAFAVQPYIKTQLGWAKRSVTLKDDEFIYGHLDIAVDEQNFFIEKCFQEAAIGAVAEINLATNNWMENFCAHLLQHTGTALIIDYGYEGPCLSNTVQAIYNKKMSPVLKHLGRADITAHVDFAPFKKIAQAQGIKTSALHTMRDFLLSCGITARAQALKNKANPQQQQDLDLSLNRLIAPEQMGNLFKVLCFYHKTLAPPIGAEQ